VLVEFEGKHGFEGQARAFEDDFRAKFVSHKPQYS
jgi:hypothetical protein